MIHQEFLSAVKEVIGTCLSAGVLIENKEPKEVLKEISEGKYKKEIAEKISELLDTLSRSSYCEKVSP